ncbi:hypothetical protein SFRURICE_001738 [Spodoptera frugiperda]|nr:hypothetical protein SFRURICE_001738 [Spodoptera frugiperda]
MNLTTPLKSKSVKPFRLESEKYSNLAPKIRHFVFFIFDISSVTLTVNTNLTTPLKSKSIKPFRLQSVPNNYTYIHTYIHTLEKHNPPSGAVGYRLSFFDVSATHTTFDIKKSKKNIKIAIVFRGRGFDPRLLSIKLDVVLSLNGLEVSPLSHCIHRYCYVLYTLQCLHHIYKTNSTLLYCLIL